MKKYLNTRGKLLDCSQPMVMGILNLTPDSFYDGGKLENAEQACARAGQLISEGAAILDLGAQSTRPGAEKVSPEAEWERLHEPLELIRKTYPDAVLSVDTFYAEVARKAAAEGADIINDVSGGTMDDQMFDTIAKLRIPYVLMHIKGTPQTMQQDIHYDNVVKEVMDYFVERIQTLTAMGVADIIIDPGFGFGKTLEHNFELLSRLRYFEILERPIMVGISRKSMVNKVLGTKPENALNGTTVLHTIALQNGANILRVHDVKEAVEVVKLSKQITHND